MKELAYCDFWAAAASTAAMSVKDILKAADWSTEGIFQKFCYRPK